MGSGQEKLKEAIVKGDTQKALDYLYKNSLPKIKKMVRQYGGTLDDAKDMFQDGVIILYRKIKLGEFGYDNPEAFFYTLCRNLWLNKMKRERIMDHPINFPDPEDHSADIQRHMIAMEKQVMIESIFDKLGSKCSEFLKLVYVKQMNTDEIAQIMHMTSKDVVKTTKNRCKNKLMALLEEFPHLSQSLSPKA